MELGSNFDLNLNDLFYKQNNVIEYLSSYASAWFNYGRSAIKSVLLVESKSLLLPEYICSSVTDCFPQENIVFYKIKDDFSIDFDDLFSKIAPNVGMIYICHYFGYLQDKEQLDLCRCRATKYNIKIIEDTTQSFFSQQEIIGDVAIASLRKWLPIPQGAVLYTLGGGICNQIRYPDRESRDNTCAAGMVLKKLFLNDGYDTNSMYRDIFVKCADGVDSCQDIERISQFAFFALKCFEVGKIIKQRKENANQLAKFLKGKGMVIRDFSDAECPLAYPVRVKNRDDFRKYLIDNRVYCAVHWPFNGFKPADRIMAKRNAEELISLPIDQRYGVKEMDYLCEIIDKYMMDL